LNVSKTEFNFWQGKFFLLSTRVSIIGMGPTTLVSNAAGYSPLTSF